MQTSTYAVENGAVQACLRRRGAEVRRAGDGEGDDGIVGEVAGLGPALGALEEVVAQAEDLVGFGAAGVEVEEGEDVREHRGLAAEVVVEAREVGADGAGVVLLQEPEALRLRPAPVVDAPRLRAPRRLVLLRERERERARSVYILCTFK